MGSRRGLLTALPGNAIRPTTGDSCRAGRIGGQGGKAYLRHPRPLNIMAHGLGIVRRERSQGDVRSISRNRREKGHALGRFVLP